MQFKYLHVDKYFHCYFSITSACCWHFRYSSLVNTGYNSYQWWLGSDEFSFSLPSSYSHFNKLKNLKLVKTNEAGDFNRNKWLPKSMTNSNTGKLVCSVFGFCCSLAILLLTVNQLGNFSAGYFGSIHLYYTNTSCCTRGPGDWKEKERLEWKQVLSGFYGRDERKWK